MKKRIVITTLLISSMLIFGACGTKTLHCDSCGKELTVSEDSNMEEDWIIFCEDCEEDVLGDDPIVEENN